MQTGHARGDGAAQTRGNHELISVRAEIEAIGKRLDGAGARGAAAQRDMRDTVDESGLARSEGAAGALRLMELGVKSHLADLQEAVDFARRRREEEAGPLKARVAEAQQRLVELRDATNLRKADGETSSHCDHGIEAIEDRMVAERETGRRLQEEFEAALEVCSHRLAAYDAIIQKRDIRIAILRAELEARTSLMQVGAWTPMFDAKTTGAQANASDLNVRGAHRRLVAPTPSVITGDPRFGLEPDPAVLEQWEILLFSDAFRRVSRP